MNEFGIATTKQRVIVCLMRTF